MGLAYVANVKIPTSIGVGLRRTDRSNSQDVEAVMKYSLASALLAILLVAPSPALACRGIDPEDLKDDEADAIVLTTIKDVRTTGANQTFPNWGPAWVATASVEASIWGNFPDKEINIPQLHPGDCYRMGQPDIGKYYVIYLRKTDGGYYPQAMPYWWVNRSGDPRAAKLKRIFPIGPVRAPTAEGARMLDLAEPRVRLPHAGAKLENYTRIYARSSAGTLRINFFRSRTPQRLMVDASEEMPTRESCRCQLHEQFVELDDLWKAGKLPPTRSSDR